MGLLGTEDSVRISSYTSGLHICIPSIRVPISVQSSVCAPCTDFCFPFQTWPRQVCSCNALDTPAGGRYSWRDLDWPHRSILVFSAHFVLTRAHPGATSRSVTHPDTTPS